MEEFPIQSTVGEGGTKSLSDEGDGVDGIGGCWGGGGEGRRGVGDDAGSISKEGMEEVEEGGLVDVGGGRGRRREKVILKQGGGKREN